MASPQQHYEALLARHYTWMCGGFDAKVAEAERVFAATGLAPTVGGRALDLGCGSGFQSVALAKLGFEVMAIDSSPTLIRELQDRAAGLPITPVIGDMRDLSPFDALAPFEVVVCMGDSLTHLPSIDDVHRLILNIRARIEKNGCLVLGFRDLTKELTGTDRIIPLRADDDRLMMTFLEYAPHHVTVNDVIVIKGPDRWETYNSAYQKLRISADDLVQHLERVGFHSINRRDERGFSTVIARA